MLIEHAWQRMDDKSETQSLHPSFVSILPHNVGRSGEARQAGVQQFSFFDVGFDWMCVA